MDWTPLAGIIGALIVGKTVKSGTKRLTAAQGSDLPLQRGTAPLAVAVVSAAAAALGADGQTANQITIEAGMIYAAATAVHSTGKNLLQLLGRLF